MEQENLPKKTPARVHIILAREADTAVVIRRGPSKKVCILGWNRKTDDFQVGQWMNGRIYERRCDLSPDGKHFIYFVYTGKFTEGSHTAISRAPFLKAIGLWGNGSAWNGGGVFINNRTYWMNDFLYGGKEFESPGNLKRSHEFPFEVNYGGECPGIYYPRLMRDGWEMIRETRSKVIFEKSLPHGWILRKEAIEGFPRKDKDGEGCYRDEHWLINTQFDLEIDCRSWTWADLDGLRLVWVEDGKLYAAAIHHKELGESKLLYDFNPLQYEKLKAPY